MKLAYRSAVMAAVMLGGTWMPFASAQDLTPVVEKLNVLDARLRSLEARRTSSRSVTAPSETTAAASSEAPRAAGDSVVLSRLAALQGDLDKLVERLRTSESNTTSLPTALPSAMSKPSATVVTDNGAGASVAGATAADHPAAAAKMESRPDPVVATVAAATATTSASVTVSPKPDKPVGITLKPGRGFTLESPDNAFSLQPGGRIQFRHSVTTYDKLRDKDNVSNFSVERFEIWLSGKAFVDWSYKFEGNFGKGNVRLGDGFIEWARTDYAKPKLGQFKVTFDRQMRTSSSEQEFVDRSATAKAFGTERDIGVMISGATRDRKFQYNAGVFNGEGENKSNTGAGQLAVARVSINPNGDFGYSESDPKSSARHLWCVDAAAAYNASSLYKDWNGDGSIAGAGDQADVFRFVLGLGYRHAGLFAQAEYYGQQERPQLTGMKLVRAYGLYAQVGYMVVPASWEAAVRYSTIDPDVNKVHNSRYEITLGVNHFLFGTGHAVKMAGDITYRMEEKDAAATYKDVEVRVQLQLTY